MKNVLHDRAKGVSRISLIIIFGLALLSSSCARKVNFSSSTVVPAAEGRVKVKKDRNSNYAVDIKIKNLTEASRLPYPKDLYVVWVETDRNGVQNLGRLNTSTSIVSKTYKASMNAVTPYRPVRVFITGEDDATIFYPGSYTVLSTRSFY